MNDPSVVKQVMDLQDMPFSDLKTKYRELFGKEPPAANRKQVIARLAYRIQEIAYGGLSEETKEKLERIYEEHGVPACLCASGNAASVRSRASRCRARD